MEYGDFTLSSGAKAMRRLLDRGEPIDGLFVANDQMAAGAYTVLQEARDPDPGRRRGGGVRRRFLCHVRESALTTVHHPIIEMGKKMAEILVDLIEGKPTDRVTQIHVAGDPGIGLTVKAGHTYRAEHTHDPCCPRATPELGRGGHRQDRAPRHRATSPTWKMRSCML